MPADPFLTPDENTSIGEPLGISLCDEITDVKLIDGKVFLVIRSTPETVWLLPLLCPVCGQAWHFEEQTIQESVEALRKKMEGFSIFGVVYNLSTTEQNIRAVQSLMYSDFTAYDTLVQNIPEHADDSVFPAISLMIGKVVPLDIDLNGTEEELRERFDIMPDQDFEEEINEWREIQDEYDVENDFMLLIHPFALLETREVFKEELDYYSS